MFKKSVVLCRLESVTTLVGEKEREINSWICHEKELERQLQTTTKSLNSYKLAIHLSLTLPPNVCV